MSPLDTLIREAALREAVQKARSRSEWCAEVPEDTRDPGSWRGGYAVDADDARLLARRCNVLSMLRELRDNVTPEMLSAGYLAMRAPIDLESDVDLALGKAAVRHAQGGRLIRMDAPQVAEAIRLLRGLRALAGVLIPEGEV